MTLSLRVWGQGANKGGVGLRGAPQFSCPELSLTTQSAWFPAGWQVECGGGSQVSPIMGLECQADGEVPFGGQHRVRVRPQDPGRNNLPDVQ